MVAKLACANFKAATQVCGGSLTSAIVSGLLHAQSVDENFH